MLWSWPEGWPSLNFDLQFGNIFRFARNKNTRGMKNLGKTKKYISKSKTHAIYKIKSLKVCMQIRKLLWVFIVCEIHKATRDVDNNTRKYLLYVWYLRMWTHSNMLCWRWKYLYSNKRNPMAVSLRADLGYTSDGDIDPLAGVHRGGGHRQGHRVQGQSATSRRSASWQTTRR